MADRYQRGFGVLDQAASLVRQPDRLAYPHGALLPGLFVRRGRRAEDRRDLLE
jgi:hypothetical protein